jgi:hypothetical protein
MEAGNRENLKEDGTGGEGEARASGDGRYVYSIIDSSDEIAVDGLGIENNTVYTIPFKDIAAAVHVCRAAPYETRDAEIAKGWVLSHCFVIDWLTDHYGTVLPFSFDTIFRGDDGGVREWLRENYEKLKRDLARFEDKSEYVVQIFYNPGMLAEKAVEEDGELKKLKEKIVRMPKGSAYMFQKKLDLKAKDLIASRVAGLAEKFGRTIREYAPEVRVEERLPSGVPEKYAGMRCAVALTCLVDKGQVGLLGAALGRINEIEGFAVRFTGPWAPFSFVDLRGA